MVDFIFGSVFSQYEAEKEMQEWDLNYTKKSGSEQVGE